MAFDKNLFLYDLAVVAIMKNEGPYVKEWLDYHLLAGVDHFYIYDHESTDNFKEILQPYIDAGIVTYIFYPGEVAQNATYNNAVSKYKFFCRYMAFIDGDEFIFPKSKPTISEVADEIFSIDPNISGLGINWACFGSNGQEKADYSRGVLERFTRRANDDFAANKHVKTISNPRRINFYFNPHFANYFENCYSVNENGNIIQGPFNNPPTFSKIIIHHYYCKSKEEYYTKINRGNVDSLKNFYSLEGFKVHDKNEVFDDSILKYREARLKMGGGTLGRQINYQQLYIALLQNLSPTFVQNVPLQFYQGKMETFLTCRKLTEYLREKILDKQAGNFFEEAALNAILKSFAGNFSIADFRLLISELPEILRLNYPVVEQIRKVCINFVPQLMNIFRMNGFWREFKEMYYFGEMLKTFDKYNHK